MHDELPAARPPEPTLDLTVDNMSFLLEQLGRDCAPDQLIRELTVNAIQAIGALRGRAGARAAPGGRVIWDHDARFTAEQGAYKLSIMDTGVGMTGPEMVRYINHLAASGRAQAPAGNFGVGAKIAAATRNPAGMVYLSWKDGQGAMIWLWRNPETGRYGLRQLARPDGARGYWAPVPDDWKPREIGAHGTAVILLGTGPAHDTTRAPDGVDGPGADGAAGPWLTRYLNARFFGFPEGVEVHAREHAGSPGSRLRRVRGMRHFLERVAEASGRVQLDGAVAHWWILPESGVPEELALRYPAAGHVGTLYQDELYELYTGRAGTAKLQSFGVAVGHHRVVLYVEPRSGMTGEVVPNTARTALQWNGRPLPWDDWADTFRGSMPEAILELMEEAVGTRDARDRTESFKQRMKSLANLLYIGGTGAEENLRRLFAQERAARRDVTREPAAGAAPPEAVPPAGAEPGAEPVARDGADAPGSGAPPAPADGRERPESGAEPANRRRPRIDLDRLLELEVAWVSEAECGAHDRAAHYIPETNTLLMNREFRVFADYVERWRAKYEGNPAAQREVEALVREWLEQPLRELVIRSHFLRGSDGWSDESIRVLLSDEALTAVSLPCYLTEMRLRTAVAQRLGRLQPRRPAA